LELTKRLLGESHPSVATSLNNLAGLYYSQGRYAEAEPLLTQALAIVEQQLGVDHPHTITCRNNLQYLRDALHRDGEAPAGSDRTTPTKGNRTTPTKGDLQTPDKSDRNSISNWLNKIIQRLRNL